MYLVQEDKDDADDIKAKEMRQQLDHHKNEQPKIIEQRLLQLENKIKLKFSNQFDSVKKAFLTLDGDYDGFITVEDLIKAVGNSGDLNFGDFQKLVMDKDSSKKGKIGYTDFSKWLGNTI